MANKVTTSTILKAALTLFSEKSYAETKMSDVAREVGISVGALYLRFENKEDLCLELIKDQTKDYEKLAGDVVRSCSNPVCALRDYISFCLGYAFKKKKLISMLYREHRIQFIKPLRDGFMKSQLKLIETILTEGAEQNVFRSIDIKKTALTIFASIRGAVMLRLIFEVGSPKQLGESLFDVLCNGIRREVL